MSQTVMDLQVRRHLMEQLAYEEIRHFLSQQFLFDPVQFMQIHGKRPEDLNGAYLRSYYDEALEMGMTPKQEVHTGFNVKFQNGRFF